MLRRISIAAASVASLVTICGCGSSGGGGAGYSSRAQALCGQALREARDLSNGGGALGPAYAGRLGAIISTELTNLDRLGPPPRGQARAVARWLNALSRVRSDLEVLARPGAAGRGAAAAAAELRESPAGRLAAAARLAGCTASATR